MIDAEADYEGRYAAADRYIRALRGRIGEDFPLSLAGFPYVDYHPAYPYSVFLGPGGAQYNQPQMYWKTIGVSVRTIFEHTYHYNRIWERPIYPLGQTYEGPGKARAAALPPLRRQLRQRPAELVGLAGDERQGVGRARRQRRRPAADRVPAEVEHPLLKRGDRGDMVVWAQEHLIGAGAELTVNGVFGKQTLRRGARLPEGPGAAGERPRRHRDLGSAARLPALPHAAGPRQRTRGQQGRRAPASPRPAARSRPRCRPRPTRSRPAAAPAGAPRGRRSAALLMTFVARGLQRS